jgi:hypothetical protein
VPFRPCIVNKNDQTWRWPMQSSLISGASRLRVPTATKGLARDNEVTAVHCLQTGRFSYCAKKSLGREDEM